MTRGFAAIAICVVGLLLAGAASAEDRCSLRSRHAPEVDLAPVHTVSFVFTGVRNEEAAVSVDGATIFRKPLETPDWSTEYSGDVSCLLAGRYRIEARIGAARAVVQLEIWETTTIYLSKHDGVLDISIWGPDAPGLD